MQILCRQTTLNTGQLSLASHHGTSSHNEYQLWLWPPLTKSSSYIKILASFVRAALCNVCLPFCQCGCMQPWPSL